MEVMYVVGAVQIALGMIALAKVIRKRAVIRFWAGWFGVLFILEGIAVIICNYGYYQLFWEDFTMRAVMAGAGLCCYSAFAMDIWKLSVCKKRITAEYISCRTNYRDRRFGTYTYRPVFSYQWEGKLYDCVESSSRLSEGKIMKYHSGNPYDIYINPNNPMINIVSRRLTAEGIFMFITGAICFLLLPIA